MTRTAITALFFLLAACASTAANDTHCFGPFCWDYWSAPIIASQAAATTVVDPAPACADHCLRAHKHKHKRHHKHSRRHRLRHRIDRSEKAPPVNGYVPALPEAVKS